MFYNDNNEQLFIDLIKGGVWVYLGMDNDFVILRKHKADKILRCPRAKFTDIFVPYDEWKD